MTNLFETATAALPLLVCYLSVPLIAFHPLTLQGQECRRQIQSHTQIQIQSHIQIQIQIHFESQAFPTSLSGHSYTQSLLIFFFVERRVLGMAS